MADLVKVQAAAKARGLSTPFLNKQIARGDVPHHRAGRAVRFDIDELKDWMKRQAESKEAYQCSPAMPDVVAIQVITSRSQVSSTKATRTVSPIQHGTSSEHQPRFERSMRTTPSCDRCRPVPVWRANKRPFCRMMWEGLNRFRSSDTHPKQGEPCPGPPTHRLTKTDRPLRPYSHIP